MGNDRKRLGDAELEIMQIIWESCTEESPVVTAGQILEKLQLNRKWPLSTLMTALNRMVDKGFLSCDKSSRNNLFAPLIPREEYQAQENHSFLQKLHGNSFRKMVASFYDSRIINSEDIDELRQFLDELEKKEEQQ